MSLSIQIFYIVDQNFSAFLYSLLIKEFYYLLFFIYHVSCSFPTFSWLYRSDVWGFILCYIEENNFVDNFAYTKMKEIVVKFFNFNSYKNRKYIIFNEQKCIWFNKFCNTKLYGSFELLSSTKNCNSAFYIMYLYETISTIWSYRVVKLFS